ncbi:MAG: diphthine--ammonia ligase [Desulfurococcales archaeon]|nr:diphthine--ammonia ligase [Desulfurococcales archaeon]
MRRFCSLLSGGKDSNYALYRALREGWEPACIVVVRPLRSDSWMFHTALLEAPKLQAEAMGLADRVVEVEVSGVREREVEELAEALERLWSERGFEVLVGGGLASHYQRRRFEAIASKLGVDIYSPAWGLDPEYYMRMLVEEGFRFIISRTSAWGLDWRLVGRIVEGDLLEDVLERARRHGFHPAFEGGEAETLVVDAPHYKKSLCIEGIVVEAGPMVYELRASRIWLSGKGAYRECLKVEYRVEARSYPRA